MRLPSPAYGAYLAFLGTVLVTVGALQYLGIGGPSGGIDIGYLAVLGLTLPVVTDLVTVACANLASVPQ